MALVMGIDVGTSSTKTIVMDESGDLFASARAEYPLLTPQPDWVEQDPKDWWNAVCKTARESLDELRTRHPSLRATDIKAISFSGQMNGAVFVDDAGNPLRPALLWLDHRAQQECDEGNGIAGDLLRSQALHVLNPINVLAKVLWLRRHEPHLYASAMHVLMPKDWVRFRLTETFACDVTDSSVTAALDLKTRQWSDEILERLEVRRDLFPVVAESPAIVGFVTEEASEETGLASGTPVCAGGGDMACMAVGGGVIRPGIISVGIGTAGHAMSLADEVNDAAFNQLWPMCHSVPGKYFWLGCSLTGGACMTWLRDLLCDDIPFLIDQANAIPAGSEGVYFMPWLEGTATPHPDAHVRGGWLGLSLRHTRAHLIRSVMEGVVYDLRQSLECFKRLNLPIDEIRVGEGGSRSSLWKQMQADILGKDVRVLETHDASAIGAAITAGLAASVFPTFEEGCRRAIRFGETVHCNTEAAVIYDECFDRYKRAYPSLSSWFR